MKEDSQKYVIFDVETTGLFPRRGDRVIEIGAVLIVKGEICEEFHSLINVPKRITKGAQRLHGITNEMLEGQPGPEQVFPEFRKFIEDATLVAHNARFDMAFLRSEFHRLGVGLSNPRICTLEMSRRLYPGLPEHTLTSVYRFLFGELPEDIQMHRALSDARMAAEIWLKIASFV